VIAVAQGLVQGQSRDNRTLGCGLKPEQPAGAGGPLSWVTAINHGSTEVRKAARRTQRVKRVRRLTGVSPNAVGQAFQPAAGVWTVSAELSGESQPAGLAEGSRWSFRAKGERPPERRRMVQHPGEGCQTRGQRPSRARLAAMSLAPRRGAGPFVPLSGGRRPEEPSATSGYRLATLRVDLLQNVQTPGAGFPACRWRSFPASPENV
jgi:hypothetical protein